MLAASNMWKRILFGRTGGHYMVWSGLLYLAVGMYCIFVNDFVPVWLAQVAWISVLCLPFAIPPFGRWLNMDITWDIKMFNLFGKKDKEKDNVVDFPAPKSVPSMPQVEPPKKEEPAKIYYRLGLTDNNRVAFSMGYSEITMSYAGCQQMIDQLTFFQNQLYDEGGPTDDPDGGLPLPEEVENKKAA
jgi:hypothetical protein